MRLIAGASWIAVLASLNVSAQVALPDWVRARGLSIFVTIFFGSMALGSVVWDQARPPANPAIGSQRVQNGKLTALPGYQGAAAAETISAMLIA